MKNYDAILAMVIRANDEIKLHKAHRAIHAWDYSGHKNKAKRAIMTVRELLMEAAKELED